MSISTQPYKGVRDFYPEDFRIQKYIFDTWSRVCEQFGYEQYTASVLEPAEIYEMKSGQEIVDNEMYTLIDKGDRRVALRPEMTPTVSRMVAGKRQELGYPLRWYSIPNLLRYERPQRGRLREHWQLNIDIFGVGTIEAEHEVIMLADQIMKAFGAKRSMYEFRINSRKFINYVLGEYLGLDEVESFTVAKLIDRIHKIDRAKFIAMVEIAISPSLRDKGTIDKLMEILDVSDIASLPNAVKSHETLAWLVQLMKLLSDAGVTNARFDVTIMRGFDYYSDTVFEVFDTDPENNRAMFGGGRYDGLVGMFGVEPVSTVGFGQGDVTMKLFLETYKLLPEPTSETELYVILIGALYAQAQPLLAKLRREGVNTAVDMSGRKLEKQIKTAEKKGISNILFVGQDEIDSEVYKLRNLKTSEEQSLSFERIVTTVKDFRKQ